MNGNCDIKNPLVRDGVSQKERILAALKPDYVKVDERDINDMLWFIRKYSEKVQYFDIDNEPAGNWKEFIENDVSTIISVISQKDTSALKTCLEKNFEFIENAGAINNNLRAAFHNIFRHIFHVCDELNHWYSKSVEGLKLREELEQSISSELKDLLKQILEAYLFAADPANNFLFDQPNEDCKDHTYEGDIFASRFKNVWVSDDTGTITAWNNYLASISANDELYGPGSTKTAQVKYAAKKLRTMANKFIGAQSRLINNSPEYLEETLENWPAHEPHVALFLAFLQLFRFAQDSMNTITKRHLDFYYKDVLRLKPNEAVPDKVHVIFELAKQVDSCLVESGTELKAGRDSEGNNVVYETAADTVYNKSSVESLKTIFIDKDDNYRIYAAPDANSKDGKGEKFESDEPKWKTLGESQKAGSGYLSEENRTMLFADTGFAVSSPVLFLSQGKRTITITFYTGDDLAGLSAKETEIRNSLSVQLSGEKEWINADIDSITVDESDNTLKFVIILEKEADPVLAFNSTKIEDHFDTEFPVLKVLLKNTTDDSYIYSSLKDITLSKLKITTDVEDKRDLILQNDNGILKAGKPFHPFTTRPGIESAFYFGSKEIFQKKLTSFTLKVDWKDVPDDKLATYFSNLLDISSNADFKVKGEVLHDNEWKEVDSSESIFDNNNAKNTKDIKFDFPGSLSFDEEIIDEEVNEYIPGIKRGFFRLVLNAPGDAFGHGLYRDKYTAAIVKYAKDPTDANKNLIPNEPYTPFINDIRINYTAETEIVLNESGGYGDLESRFVHIYPFGIKNEGREHPEISYLMPQYDFYDGEKNVESEGQLFIGIKGLDPPENLSLLFQIAEGSADPELPQPDVYWSYMKDDEWINFADTEILSDATKGLIKTGIIKFVMPSGISSKNSVLPAGYFWIRASVAENSAAICESLDIIAQAGTAEFTDNNNADDLLESVLPAETISKLVNKDASIKKVKQPYASLGGKARETDQSFYTRVSERLRHKDRGITIWDYERLVLQHFPDIYKVKCINHSTYIPDASEFAPGYVTVVVIPGLFNKNAVNPLEPRASVGTLSDIKEFLKKKISMFAAENIQVLNPLYEKIKVEFGVSLREGYDWGYYKKKLNEDIKEFLSPWAFKESSDITFGAKIHRSVILNFVEEREYVDYVTEFKMRHILPDETGPGVYVEEAVPTTSRSIFVSNDEHDISEVVNC